MSKLNLIITDRAKEDISLITEYIAKDNIKAAKAMSKYLYKICLTLADYPNIGTVRPDFTYKDFRFYVIKKHYIIAYKTDETNIYISRVLSGYQDICMLL